MIDNWKDFLAAEEQEPYMIGLKRLISEEASELVPRPKNVFAAFRFTSYQDTRVVILGTEPYARSGEADGLAFSCAKPKYIPMGLKAIFRELMVSTGIVRYNPDLTHWARQGVLLLNRTLTTQVEKTRAHEGLGWEVFTEKVIRHLSSTKNDLVFVLWGANAQLSEEFIDKDRGHLVLKAVHPASDIFKTENVFYGCNHFPLINKHLQEKGQEVIDWS